MQEGKVACIIIKDLSRFGRNYIEVGDYMERFFPLLEVRFISVFDHYDSLENPIEIEVGFKNLFHDLYSRDLSKKVKAVKQLYQKRGIYNGGDVPYGYKRADNKYITYIPDPKAAKTVKEIFILAAKGMTTVEIADILNRGKIPTPGAYKNQYTDRNYRLKNQRSNLWSSTQVREIIQNEVYIGVFLCHKSSTIKPRQSRRNDKSEFIRFEHNHEQLVEKELFLRAQTIIVSQKKRGSYKKGYMSILKGKVKCGCCGYAMNQSGKISKYSCRMGNSCGSYIKIETRILEETILKILLKWIEIFHKEIQNRKCSENKEKKRMLEIKKEHCKVSHFHLYELWKEGQITKEQYILKKKQFIIQEEQYQTKNIDKNFFPEIQRLTKELVERFVEKIYIYSTNRIEIRWKFQQEI